MAEVVDLVDSDTDVPTREQEKTFQMRTNMHMRFALNMMSPSFQSFTDAASWRALLTVEFWSLAFPGVVRRAER